MLELLDLSRRFGDIVALDGVTFSVPDGEIVGFVGPNGAGKTTTMRIALGVLEPDAGDVRWNGFAIDAEARRRFGYMPEERGLYPKMKVLEQLVYLARLHGLTRPDASRRAAETIEVLGVAERANDRVENLSLGNQQRVQLAAALVHRPDVLILDEPFSGLDPVGVDALTGVLRGEAEGRGVPVVFSSHQLELVERLCDRVVLIDHGRIVAAGTIEELRSSRERRRLRVQVAGAPDDWYDAIPGRPARGGHAERRRRAGAGRRRRRAARAGSGARRRATSRTSAGSARRWPSCSGRRCRREPPRRRRGLRCAGDRPRDVVARRATGLLVSPARQGIRDLERHHAGRAHRPHPHQRVRGERHPDVRPGAARAGVGAAGTAGRAGRRRAGDGHPHAAGRGS